MFVIAVKIAAPVMAVLFLTQIALGILAKAVPQVNILMTSFPLTIGLGLLFLGSPSIFSGPILRISLKNPAREWSSPFCP